MISGQLAPGLLIASPPLGDPNFDRTVVLLALHNEHGALGFVVNRLAPLELGELLGLAGYGDGFGAIRGKVYVGGPVEPSSGWVLGSREALGLVEASDVAEAVRSSRPPASGPRSESEPPGSAGGVIAVGERLVVTSSRKVFNEVARQAKTGPEEAETAARRLVILGYSGWGPGQLEAEIGAGSWLPAEVDERILFETEVAARWGRTYENLGLSTLGAISMRTVGEA